MRRTSATSDRHSCCQARYNTHDTGGGAAESAAHRGARRPCRGAHVLTCCTRGCIFTSRFTQTLALSRRSGSPMVPNRPKGTTSTRSIQDRPMVAWIGRQLMLTALSDRHGQHPRPVRYRGITQRSFPRFCWLHAWPPIVVAGRAR